MHLLPRKEFDSEEVAETDYLAKPDPNTTNANCQVHSTHISDSLLTSMCRCCVHFLTGQEACLKLKILRIKLISMLLIKRNISYTLRSDHNITCVHYTLEMLWMAMPHIIIYTFLNT